MTNILAAVTAALGICLVVAACAVAFYHQNHPKGHQ